ncbi:conserved hypothetical protein [Ricinus communis]|uniref:Uncharacterized protein n=1 Tax=Ricinus communis TaxID=3988 RepID=B9S3W3_RICCO|nr:conserved hypothetical protein [Ricinus communis]
MKVQTSARCILIKDRQTIHFLTGYGLLDGNSQLNSNPENVERDHQKKVKKSDEKIVRL